MHIILAFLRIGLKIIRLEIWNHCGYPQNGEIWSSKIWLHGSNEENIITVLSLISPSLDLLADFLSSNTSSPIFRCFFLEPLPLKTSPLGAWLTVLCLRSTLGRGGIPDRNLVSDWDLFIGRGLTSGRDGWFRCGGCSCSLTNIQ